MRLDWPLLLLAASPLPLAADPAPQAAPAETQDCAGTEQACPAFPKAATIAEAFLHLQLAVGALAERAQFDPELSPSSVTAIKAQINELQGMFLASANTPAEEAYIANLDVTAGAILQATEERETKAANDLLATIERDFQIKLATARSAMGAENGKPGTIPATIVTRRGTREVRGYRIKLAEGLQTRFPPTIVFDRLTDPGTTRNITPGIYLVYAYLPGPGNTERVAGKELLDIGLDGQAKPVLDLSVE